MSEDYSKRPIILTSHNPNTDPVIGHVEERDGELVGIVYSEELAEIAADLDDYMGASWWPAWFCRLRWSILKQFGLR